MNSLEESIRNQIKVHSTGFYTVMMKGASPLLYRTPDTDYFRWKYWIIPFNRNHHWLLGIVEFSEHQIVNINAPCKATIRMFDSKLGLNANRYCQDLCFQFLLREFHKK